MIAEAISTTKEALVSDLRRNLGLADGDIIAVHSSMKSLGRVEGGPVAFIEALMEAVGGVSKGTVLMPCFNGPDDVVDLRSTACRLGLVPETFRTYPGVVRSVNHTHSVAAIGRHAERLAASHRGKTPLGVDTPFHELAKMGGWILHVGCNMTTSSIIHVAESVAKAPYLGIAYQAYDKPIRLVVSDSESFVCLPVENPGCSRNFMVVQDELDRLGLLRKGKVAQAESFKVKGLDVIETTSKLISERGMGVLLCDSDSCRVCMAKKELLGKLGVK